MRARALSIAGFDPTGGAGVLQDARTFEACGVWGLAVVTAVTAQDTTGVHSWEPVSARLVARQLAAIISDASPSAIKTGMLGTAELVDAVVDGLPTDVPVVVDPVLRASTGADLGKADLLDAIRSRLVPRADVITPNLAEAAALTGIRVDDMSSMREAAFALIALGAKSAIVTGGHLSGGSVDVVVDDGGTLHELRAARIHTRDDHGTGCVFASAIAAGLALGLPFVGAARVAKGMVTRALINAERFGDGGGPVHPMAEERPWPLAGHPFE